MLQADQLKVVATLSKLLRRKQLLLAQLKTMNTRTAATQAGQPVSMLLQRSYTWLFLALESTNLSIQPLLTAMRVLTQAMGECNENPKLTFGMGSAWATAAAADAVRAVLRDPTASAQVSLCAASRDRLLYSTAHSKAVAEGVVMQCLPVLVQASAATTSPAAAQVDIPRTVEHIRASCTRQLQLVHNAMSFLAAMQWCSQERLTPWETFALLQRHLEELRPTHTVNDALYRDLEATLGMVRSVLCVQAPM